MKKDHKIFLLLAGLVLIIYGQSLWGGFVFDDRGIGEHQALLSSLSNLKDVAMFPYWTEDAGLYRPVTLLSYAFNVIFLGGSAFSFHLINILLYVGICAALFILLKRLFGDEKLAFVSALIFLVLPIHSEVVANITGRSELMALLFSLLLLIEFTKSKMNCWLAGLYMLLAIGAKETAVAALPLALLVILIKEHPTRQNLVQIAGQYFRSISAAVMGASIYFFVRFFVLGPDHFLGVETSLIENPLLFADAKGRVATASSILWMYVQKSLVPLGFCSDYSYNQIPVVGFGSWRAIAGALIYVSSLIAAPLLIFRKPIVGFALTWFAMSFLLVSNFLFPIGTIAGERLFFFPSVALAILLAYLLAKINQQAVVFLLIGMYALFALHRQSVWLTEERLFVNAGVCAPQSVLSLSNLGTVYYFRGEYDKAAEVLERSRAIKPIYSKGLNNLGLVYWKQGRNAEAQELYHEALRQKYPYPGAIENLVLLKLSEKDKPGALRWLRIEYPNVGDSVLRSLF